MASAWAVLWEAFGEYGLPEALLCDGSFAGYRLLVGAGVVGEWVRVEDTDHEVRLFYDWKEIRRVASQAGPGTQDSRTNHHHARP
jgi:hypothetical protein